MIRAIRVEAAGDWRATAADTVVLDYDDRHRRRIAMTGVRGFSFLLDLDEAVALRHGDGLVLEDGRIIEVSAAPELLSEIRARNGDHMIRIAWHLGNRHLPTQMVGSKLRIRRDHVIEEMVQGLGAEVAHIEAAFDPEGGAYAHGHGGHHSHHHHDHDHDHATEPVTATITGAMIIASTIGMIMSAGIGAAPIMAESLLPLFAWLSPSYPVGAYAYSHGLEWAVEAGDVKDRASLGDWLQDILQHGGGRNDAILFVLAYRAIESEEDFARVAELAAALTPSRERKLETLQQGRAFVEATAAAWPSDRFVRRMCAAGPDIAYPVAVGAAAASHEIPLLAALEAYLQAFASNLVSAVVRAVPLGQTDGQRVIAELAPLVRATAAEAAHATEDDLGGATFRLDLASMRHETQYTRLFRS